MSKVDPNHDRTKNSCSICWHFSYLKRVSQSQRNLCHSSESLKNQIALTAAQFRGTNQHDPSEYMVQILNGCPMFKELTSHQSLQTYTCLKCDTKTQKVDERNIIIQPMKREDENLNLNQMLSKLQVSSCTKICDSCKCNGLHQVSEELLILPSVLIINLQRFIQVTDERTFDSQRRRKSLRLAKVDKS